MVDSADSDLVRDAQLAGDAPDPAAAFLDTVLDAMPDGVLACSRTGVPIVVNRAARTLYETVVGRAWDDHGGRAWFDDLLTSAAERESARRGLPAALYDLSGIDVPVAGTDAEHTVRVTGRPVLRFDGPAMGSVVHLHLHLPRSGLERRRDPAEARDPVTGLPGRTAVMRRTEIALGDPVTRPVALLLADVDRFRDVNDRCGYAVGDRLLAMLATDLVTAIGDDAWVGHLGGDQFVVLCAGPAPAGTYDDLALRVTEAAARPRRLDDHEVLVTATVGIAIAEDRGGGAPGLVHDAATAMRTARADRLGGIATFIPAMRLDEGERALTDALHHGELVVHYQPKIDLISDRMVGVEALVRWERPGVGLVPPDEFIPLAEATGLVVELGRFVLRQACADAVRWHALCPDRVPLRVCVNVSPKQFETGISDVVTGVLDEVGIPPGTLGIEVTESTLMRDVEAARRTLASLRTLGVLVALDDFGTGYSSLAYLRRFPVDELKIDKSFVDGLGRDAGDSAVVAGIVSLAHALELTVVAEGVENAVQIGELRRIGCEGAQGYYFARPVPAGEIDRMLQVERVPVPEPVDGGALGNDRVVVADDAADVLMLARLSLTSAGFDVMEVTDGKAAIEAVQQTRPACVVLDVAMPGMDGLDVCRTLRADPATSDCTIVMLTATDSASDKIAAFAAGADDYIVKPFSPRDLVGRLRAADRRRHGGSRP